jgi:hypothetical protein
VNISFIVNETEAAEVVKALHLDFFEAQKSAGLSDTGAGEKK